nr:hypothetical protein [Tanacetum cinerariifolium]
SPGTAPSAGNVGGGEPAARPHAQPLGHGQSPGDDSSRAGAAKRPGRRNRSGHPSGRSVSGPAPTGGNRQGHVAQRPRHRV